MIVYHGSNIIVAYPKILRSEYGRDFGFGFYTTGIKEQAVRWAIRKVKLTARKSGVYSPYVSIYEFDENAYHSLRCKLFADASMEWLDMVCACRSDIAYSHGYDIVTGKIANDNVGEAVTYVLQGIMRKEYAVERLIFEKINNQICFCTEAALGCLRYTGFLDCR